MSLPTIRTHEWTRDGFYISTDPTLLSPQAINTAFASDALPWAKELTPEELTVMINHSVCFGLYSATAEVADTHTSPSTSSHPAHSEHAEDPKPAQIGLARLTTDCTTMAYLTDVYVLPEWGGRGLGSWLVGCVREWWDEMPSGRRLLLIASEGRGEEYYKGALGAGRLEDESAKGGERYRVFTARGRGVRV
ncbi:hypothetical protein OHC33_000042 [Knufia fluminis]|uniref:N-acetyltransferase domain-containing protein n=1 Tax=Knufia fluminis TaxID=191047 RepID=A0AAN8F1C1_9EURO|nr:hypothetical protein OHC33_000042 [Knufia fluminis]